MKLRDALAGVAPVELRGDDGVEVTSVAHDSRRIEAGAIYCCIPGASADGHDFAASAVGSGATALLVERFVDDVGPEIPQARVERVRAVMGAIASRVYGDPSASVPVLGVTGTNGKTTTTYLLEAIGVAAGLDAGVIGTVETRIAGRRVDVPLTTPEATDLQGLLARMRDDGVGLVAMEVSSHALELGRVDGTRFAVGTFLNLSQDHLDFHGTMDEYFAAKARLFVPERVGAAAVNAADPKGADVIERCRAAGIPVVTFSGVPGVAADVCADEVSLAPTHTEFTLDASERGGRVRVTTPLLGSFNLENAVAAAATALAAGLPLDASVAGLAGAVAPPGRFEPVDRGQDFGVVVDYAHTPDALARVLGAAREIAAGGRVSVVFGCGGDRDRGKRPLMGRAAALGADRVYVTSDNPRSESPEAIIVEILGGIPGDVTPAVEADRAQAIESALADAGPGDLVVVAGKGHETGQVVGDVVHPFDDRKVVTEALERLCG